MDRDMERIEGAHAEQARNKAFQPTNQMMMSGGSCDIQAASRERTAREVLAELCMLKQAEIDELNELLKALPQELPYRADRALRRLIQK